MAISRIEDTELVNKTISELSDRPTDPKTAGGDGLTASQLKERYDALPKLVKDRLNKLIDALTGYDPVAETYTAELLAATLKVSSDQTLSAFVEAITAAVATKYAKPVTGIPATDLAEAVQTSLDKADTAIQSHQDISGKVDVSDFEALVALVSGKTEAESVASYSALVTKLSAMSKTDYNVGQTIYVETADVPDVWVKAKGDSSASYTYTTDAAFITALKAGTLQIGYFVLSPMETEKVDITGKVDKSSVTSSPTASSVMGRDANGRSQVEAGAADKDAVNKGQMDAGLAGKANITGKYATLGAGFADVAAQIETDREIEDADEACPPVVFGSVGGAAEVQDGLMKFTELRGHTIKGNQQLLSSKSASVILRGKNQCPGLDEYFPVLPGETYEVSGISAGGYLQEYDGNKTLIKTSSEITSATDITLDSQTVFCKLQATTYTIPFCYILWSTPGETPEAYSAQTVTLPNLELRSAGSAYDVVYQQGGGKRRIGSVDLGSLTWYYLDTADHETMYTTGLQSLAKFPASDSTVANILCVPFTTVTRNQQYNHTADGIIAMNDGGTLFVYSSTMGTSVEDFKTAMDGVTLYYESTTETDITTTENPGWDEFVEIDNFGTIEFTQDPAQTVPVPQAYFIRYTVNLVEFLDSLYVHCGGDVSKIPIGIPAPPTSNGTYTLKVTVSSGTPTYSWVADT